MGWHDQRFTPRAAAIEKPCKVCGRSMWLPPSRAAHYATCGGQCSTDRRTAAREARTRPCETCGKPFTPRLTQLRRGGGRFCSQRCNTAGVAALAAAEDRKVAAIKAARAAGKWTVLSGENNANWRGGKEAQRARRKPKDAAWLRRYRAANPHKTREWAQNRRCRKHGERLPYGTIPKLGGLQRWKCAICRANVRDGYHVDHVVPIAKGGRHVPRNLQLLCPTCNVRKNAKDPIAYMQELGRLL